MDNTKGVAVVSEKILNITNGDCAVDVFKQAKLLGDYLPWRDILYEGPVPAVQSLTELSKIRAEYISQQGWGEFSVVHRDFMQRDDVLATHGDYDKVILWFEHDLTDQLQLMQLLHWFHDNLDATTQLNLICVDQYLGPLSPEAMLALRSYETVVSRAQLESGKKAWDAFCHNTPEQWCALLDADTGVLPFFDAAVRRMLEEFPSCVNGLSRSEQQALEIISQGEQRPGRVFAENLNREEKRFMGDSSFWNLLRGFLESSPNLLSLPSGKCLSLPTSPDQKLSITETGQVVLKGEMNFLQVRPIDRWIGGVHLTMDDSWCWDASMQTVKQLK